LAGEGEAKSFLHHDCEQKDFAFYERSRQKYVEEFVTSPVLGDSSVPHDQF
jgi:hypothetical protein